MVSRAGDPPAGNPVRQPRNLRRAAQGYLPLGESGPTAKSSGLRSVNFRPRNVSSLISITSFHYNDSG